MKSSDGLSFDFTAEQQLFRQTMRELADREFPKPYCRAIEGQDSFPYELWDKIAELGLHGIGIPEEHGGQGGTIVEQMIVAEELSRTLAGLIWIWGATSFSGGKSVGLYGTEEQKQRILPDIAAGRLRVAAAITEPDGGTDVLGALRTRAEPADGGWVINGTKIWSTTSHVADLLFVLARTSVGARKSDGITLFICDAKQPGIVATPIPKLGMRSIGSCEVQLTDVFVPAENVLGEVDQGWSQLVQTLNNERIMVAAQCCGILQGVLEDMVAYAKERMAFGKPIGQFQAVQHMIADTFARMESARWHMYRAAWLQVLGRPCGIEATMAKIVASEAAVAAADQGIQMLGGYGYAMEYDMQRYWRDARILRIAPIPNEMARNYLAQSFGLPRSY